MKYICIGLLLVLSSCSTSYLSKQQALKKMLVNNKSPSKSKEVFPEASSYKLLSQQENGLYLFINGNYNDSLEKLYSAKSTYTQMFEEAKINIGNVTTNTLASTILDDNINSYKGSLYEQIFVNYYIMLNNIALQNWDKVKADIIEMQNTQKYILNLKQKEIIQSEQQIDHLMSIYGVQSYDITDTIKKHSQHRANVKEKFLSANIYFISGIINEKNHNYNNALIDYKKAFEVNPNNIYIRQNLLRLSNMLDKSFASYLTNLHPKEKSITQKEYYKQASLTIIYEQGFIPAKVQTPIVVALKDTAYRINILSLQKPEDNDNISINLDNEILSGEVSTNLDTMQSYQLDLDMPTILLRELSRLISQIGVQNISSSNILKFATTIMNLAHNSDLRTWSLLPQSIQIININKSSIDLSSITINGKVIEIPAIKVIKGHHALLHIYKAKSQLYTKVLYNTLK